MGREQTLPDRPVADPDGLDAVVADDHLYLTIEVELEDSRVATAGVAPHQVAALDANRMEHARAIGQ